jgi:L-threonylcarbamoyladenylate synthase
LRWDLGETRGTVAIRMPDHEGALELLGRTGPLAVSSANNTGHPAATTADEAEEMLGWGVEVILDGGTSNGSVASTIVDCTGTRPRVLREGAISVAELTKVLEGLGTELETDPDPGTDSA